MKKLLLLTVVFVFAVSAAHAAASDAATGHAEAQIVAPISVVEADGAKLNFGKWVKPSAAGTVTVTAAASPTVTPSSGLQEVTGSSPSADHFEVTNDENLSYSVTLPTSAVTLNGSVSGTMTATAFTSACVPNCASSGDLYVGATLNIGANQAAGTYTGSYEITLTY